MATPSYTAPVWIEGKRFRHALSQRNFACAQLGLGWQWWPISKMSGSIFNPPPSGRGGWQPVDGSGLA
jgi:hypothetical protein